MEAFMSLTETLRKEIKSGNLPPIFNSTDIKNAGIEDANNNISNYDKKNKGLHNTHSTVLVSSVIDGVHYYTFDEQLFE